MRKFMKPAIAAMRSVCRERFEAFGTAGRAPGIKVIPMSEMAKRYAAGSPRRARLSAVPLPPPRHAPQTTASPSAPGSGQSAFQHKP